MAKKEKEEDRIERIIRGLLKLPQNRRCINCNTLGPQYVCTTFFTFVCINCSGVHREFSHRVKSVSMAKFTAEEVNSLQAGGNERARQIYFKDWDPLRNSYPDSSNLLRLRDFIKHVYVDRKYSGDRSHDRIYRPRLGEREESYGSRKVRPYWDGCRSPNYEDKYQQSERSRPGGRSDESIVKYYYDERRSPRYSHETSRSGGLKKSPVRFEIVDDRVRSGRESRAGSSSSNCQKMVDRSIKDTVGENVPGEASKINDRKGAVSSSQNQITASSSNKESTSEQSVEEKNPQSLIDFNTDPTASDSAEGPQTQRNDQGGGNCNFNEASAKQEAPPTPKPNTLEFLLLELMPSAEPSGSVSNISNNDNPPSTTLPDNSGVSSKLPGSHVPTGGASPEQPLMQLLALPDSAGISTNFPESNNSGVPNIPANSVPRGSSMGQIDASATVSGANMGTVNITPAASMGGISTPFSCSEATGDGMLIGAMAEASAAEQKLLLLEAAPAQPSNEISPQTVINIESDSPCKVPKEQPVSIMQQHQLSAFPAVVDSSTGLQTNTTSIGAQNNLPLTSVNMLNPEAPSCASAEVPSEAVTVLQNSDFGVSSQGFPAETKSSERKELPMDLFTMTYPPVGSTPGWRNTLPYGTGFSMLYHPNAVPVMPYPNQAKSSNPFDFSNESTLIQVSPFSSVGNMQVAHSNVSAPMALLPTTTIPANPSGLMETQTPYSYPSAFPLQTSSFSSLAPPGLQMGQQLQMTMEPSRGMALGVGVGFGSNAHYGSQNTTQQAQAPGAGGYQLPYPSTSFPSRGGNPFE